MRKLLKRHPSSPCAAVVGIEVDVARPRPGLLALRYGVTGATSGVSLPPRTSPARTDGLWRHTCFEAFVRAGPGEAYYEFNFAPSTQWAAYRFDGYRQGMSPADQPVAPQIEVRPTDGGFELLVSLALDGTADLPTAPTWNIGLSAVIEGADGQVSYWALAHPPGKADFHHADCFALELPATGGP